MAWGPVSKCLVAADCSGVNDACQTRTCAQGKCGTTFASAGTVLPVQTGGDCQKASCDGSGAAVQQIDDVDLPDDKNPCTDDVCANGAPSNPPKAQGTGCGTAMGAPLVCDARGACVGCNAPTDCLGVDDECQARTCFNGSCGVTFTGANTPVAAQTAADCLQAVCDGDGHVASIADGSDLPLDDGNACTSEACAAGVPAHPIKVNGAACTDGNTCTVSDTCQAGACAGGSPMVCGAGTTCVAGACLAPGCAGVVGLPGLPETAVDTPPVAMTAADVNGDGKPDVVIAIENTDSVSVLLGLGNGTFAPPVNYPVGSFPVSVEAADLNGDAKPDLITANFGGNVTVLLNLATASSPPPSTTRRARTPPGPPRRTSTATANPISWWPTTTATVSG